MWSPLRAGTTLTDQTRVSSGLVARCCAGAGLVTFPVRFMAVVFRPFKGEVLDAVVTTVNKMGFFAEVGPLQVFVSKHSMPGDLEFDPQSNPPSYVSQISDDQPVRIAKDSEVRLRLIGIRVDATEASPPPRSLSNPTEPALGCSQRHTPAAALPRRRSLP